MPQLSPYLMFNGNCAEAMRFYERALGGKLEMMTHAESPIPPDQLPPGSENRVMHARLILDGGSVLMASDAMASENYKGITEVALSLTYPSAAEAERIFNALAEGGKVSMPFQKTFWAEGFGMLSDRFGTPWMLNAYSAPA